MAGFDFQVNSTVLVTALGIWDENSNGLNQNHQVGLWNAGGTLLASTTVTNAATPVASTNASGRWLFNSITALQLTPGTYVIGALYLEDGGDTIRGDATVTTSPLITLGSPRVNVQVPAVLAQPTSQFPLAAAAFFGPNLQLEDAGIPEPSTILLMSAGLGLVGLRRLRR